ncbi:MAG TPA: gliding motility-associated C-terminal domain-containing protein, partial [Prolixibacteraceae bacterium]|nr:gliding motility-associated C-terminal domain-containing protein [Prolixibacteraceae bacterium]
TCTVVTGTIHVKSPVVSGYQYSNNDLTYQDNPTFIGLMPGTYTITVKNNEGCISGAFIQIIDEQPLLPEPPVTSAIQPTCLVELGTIIINSPTGSGYEFRIDNGSSWTSSTTFAGLNPGNYKVSVKTGAGCISEPMETTIDPVPNLPQAPDIQILAKPTCKQPLAGIVAIKPVSGSNYLYSLDGSTYSTVTEFNNIAEGLHTVTVIDGTTSCTNSTFVNIEREKDPQSASLEVSPVNCYSPKGIITIKSPIDESKYYYSLDGKEYTAGTTFANLLPGSVHTITIQDISTGCLSAPTSVVIGTIPANPATPLLALTATPTCSNPDGNVSVLSPVNSGSKIYSYSIDGIKFQTSPVFADLIGTTTYTVVVRDDVSGCTSSATAIYVPAVPPPPVISAIGVNPKCYGDTYTITISAPPVVSAGKTYSFDGIYTFYYDGGQFDNVKISGGIATITGTLTASKDFKNIHFTANGCTSTGTNTSISIVSPAAIDLRIVQVTEQAVKGTQQGAIDIDAKGGSGLLSYLWSNGATTQDLNPIKYGTYSVVVTDTKKCTAALTVKVPLNNPPVARPDVFTTNCSMVSGNLLDDNGSGKDYDPDPVEQADFISMNTALVVKPSHAANYTINADGSFVYTAEANFTGDDIFVYEIYDKLKQTATATVTIHIEADFDGDGIADLIDPDADGDGILNVDEALPGQDWKTADFDGDGHPNWLDIDSDNDGIVDNVEAQPTAGYIPPSGKDVNHNGIDDAYDPAMGGVKIIPVNTDANLYMPDNLPDFLDTDSDNDHVPDYIEGHDLNADGKVDEGHLITGKDSDSDGLDDAWDTIPNGCNNLNATGSNAYIQDFDGDGIRDWRDDNDDDDEYPTRLEDLNGDGDYSNDVTGHVGHPEYLWYGRDCSLFIPDAFSPNDDNVHDYFQIYCIEQYPNAKMYIFDQQGNKLFEKDHYGNVDYWGSHEQAWWDGTTTNRIAAVNGKKVVPGTYYYVLKLGNGETKKSFVFVSY